MVNPISWISSVSNLFVLRYVFHGRNIYVHTRIVMIVGQILHYTKSFRKLSRSVFHKLDNEENVYGWQVKEFRKNLHYAKL